MLGIHRQMSPFRRLGVGAHGVLCQHGEEVDEVITREKIAEGSMESNGSTSLVRIGDPKGM